MRAKVVRESFSGLYGLVDFSITHMNKMYRYTVVWFAIPRQENAGIVGIGKQVVLQL